MNPNAIEIRHLRQFLAVVDTGSFSRAAELLHVAQPAISHHIKRLEDALGEPVFIRTGRGVTLTPFGERMLEPARSVLTAMEILHAKARTPIRELVQFGLPMTVSPLISIDLLRRFGTNWPDTRLLISDRMSAVLAELLADGRLDAAILFNNQNHPRLSTQPFLNEPMYLVGHRDAFQPQQQVRLDDLGAYPLVLPDRRNAVHQLVRDAALHKGVHLNLRYEIDVVSEIVPVVRRGEAFAVLAPIAFAASIAAGEVSAARLCEPEVHRTWSWAVPIDAPTHPALDSLRAIATEELRSKTAASLATLGAAWA